MKVWMDSTLSLDPEATAYYLIIAVHRQSAGRDEPRRQHAHAWRQCRARRHALACRCASIVMHRQLVALDFKTMRTISVRSPTTPKPCASPSCRRSKTRPASSRRSIRHCRPQVPAAGAIKASGSEVYDSGARLERCAAEPVLHGVRRRDEGARAAARVAVERASSECGRADRAARHCPRA